MKSTPGTPVPKHLLLLSPRACSVVAVAVYLTAGGSAWAQPSKNKPATAPSLSARSAQAQRLTFAPFKPLRTLYVSPRGSDSSAEPTSISRPLRTIGKAASIAKPGDLISLRAGVYRESIQPMASGTAENPIVFRAYPGESVTISGADVVSGAWTLKPSSKGRLSNWASSTFKSQLNQAEQFS
jgi:hypothetical protein